MRNISLFSSTPDMEAGDLSLECLWEQLDLKRNKTEEYAEMLHRVMKKFTFIDVAKQLLTKLSSNICYVRDMDHFACLAEKADIEWMVVPSFERGVNCLEKKRTMDALLSFVQPLVQFATIPSFDKREDHSYTMEDFEGVAEKAALTMKIIQNLITKCLSRAITNEEGVHSKGVTVGLDEDTAKKVLLPGDGFEIQLSPPCGQGRELQSHSKLLISSSTEILILCISHLRPQLWSSEQSEKSAQNLLHVICQYYEVDEPKQLLCGGTFNDRIVDGELECILKILQLKLTRDNWTKNPGFWAVYEWCLFQTRFPNLSSYFECFLPPALLFVDDYKNESKIRGIQCIQYITDNVSAAELRRYGRADVMYSALSHLLYSQELEVLQVLFPCLLAILGVVEKSPCCADIPRKSCRYDEIFRRILTSMEMENKIALRHLYSVHLNAFIVIMGITILKHFGRLLRVIFNYLEIYDGPNERARIDTLHCLQTVIRTAWIRIPNHCEDIFKAVFKLIVDISLDETTTPQEVKDEMISSATDCLILLKFTCKEKVISICQELQGLEQLNNVCKDLIHKILDATAAPED